MRPRWTRILAALVAITSVAILVALIAIILAVAAIAASNEKTINLIEPTIVGSITLQPGQYTIPGLGRPPNKSAGLTLEDSLVTRRHEC